jgi:phage pi2 protein 07
MKLYKKIAQTLQARENCYKNKNHSWFDKHENVLNNIERDYFPSGNGFDGYCLINYKECKENKIVIMFEWHCMTEHGYYDGWLIFDIIVTPNLKHDFDTKIVWYSYKNDKYKVTKYKPILEEYFYDTWNEILDTEYKEC